MRCDGRHNTISTAAAKNSRNATVPKLPTALNRRLANAEPNCKRTMPTSSSVGGGISPKVRPAREVRDDRGDGSRLVLSTFKVATRGLSTIGRRASRDFPRFRDKRPKEL